MTATKISDLREIADSEPLKASDVSNELISKNEFVVSSLNEIGANIANKVSEIDPQNGKRLSEIASELRNISEEIKTFRNDLIDKQDTSIKHTSDESKEEKVSIINNEVEKTSNNESIWDKLKGGLSSLLGLFGFSTLMFKSPLRWFAGILRNYASQLIKPFKPIIWPIVKPLLWPITKALKLLGISKLAGSALDKFNSFIDDDPENKKTSKADKPEKTSKPSIEKTPSIEKKPGFFSKTASKVSSITSKAIESAKNIASNTVEKSKNLAKNASSFLMEWGLKAFNNIKNLASSAWDNAVKKASEGYKYIKGKALQGFSRMVEVLFDKILPPKLSRVLKEMLSKLGPIKARLAKLGGKAFSKMIPGAGFAIGVYMAWDLFSRGKYTLAVLSAISAIISLFPGIGGIVAVCLDILVGVADMFTDPKGFEELNKEQEKASKYVKVRILDADKIEKFSDKEKETFKKAEEYAASSGGTYIAQDDGTLVKISDKTDDIDYDKSIKNNAVIKVTEVQGDAAKYIKTDKYWEEKSKVKRDKGGNRIKTDTKPDTVKPESIINQENQNPDISKTSYTGGSAQTVGADAAAEFTKFHSGGKGACAKYVRSYLMAAGYPLQSWPVSAADYVGTLPKYGFTQISGDPRTPEDPRGTKFAYKEGDISIIQRFGKHRHGHIAVFNGKQWVSDFKQNNLDIYGNTPKGAISIWRDTQGVYPTKETADAKMSNMQQSFKNALNGIKDNPGSPNAKTVKEPVPDMEIKVASAPVETKPDNIKSSNSNNSIETKSSLPNINTEPKITQNVQRSEPKTITPVLPKVASYTQTPQQTIVNNSVINTLNQQEPGSLLDSFVL